MKICVYSPFFFVMVNGSPKDFFKGSRGLRQGDSLSPYLFIMVADLLGRLTTKAKVVGLIEGFLSINGSPIVLFIQFAADSLFLLKAQMEGHRNLRCILLIMEAATGLKVNWSKSLLCSVGNVPEMEPRERMGKKLAHWKGNYLSKGGKLVLLKSVLANVSSYFQSLYQALASIINQMERMQQDFLWGSCQG